MTGFIVGYLLVGCAIAFTLIVITPKIKVDDIATTIAIILCILVWPIIVTAAVILLFKKRE